MIKQFLLIIFCTMQFSSFGQIDTTHAFDFWIGHWDVSWSEGEGKTGSGTNHIEQVLDGKVIQENFEVLTGQTTGYKGRSLSVYNPPSKTWRQAWTDNQGGYFDFTGDLSGPNPMFKTAIREKDGKQLISRMIFKDITHDKFTWDWEGSQDGGKTWKLNWRIQYVRQS